MNVSQSTQELVNTHSSIDYSAILSALDTTINELAAQLEQLATQHAQVEDQHNQLIADRDAILAAAGQVNG